MKLHRDILIAGIIRKRKPIIPGGLDCIYPDDHVIVISAKRHLSDLSDIVL